MPVLRSRKAHKFVDEAEEFYGEEMHPFVALSPEGTVQEPTIENETEKAEQLHLTEPQPNAGRLGNLWKKFNELLRLRS